VQAGGLVFLSGQIPLDPASNRLVDGDFDAQADRVILNIQAVAKAAGATLGDVVKITVYLTDLSHFAAVNEAMARHFTEPYPARAALGVSALPRGALVEMDAVMVL
jgi:reactive intermediate/imine deaminase